MQPIQALKDKDTDEKVKKKLTYGKKNWPKKLEKYQEQETILGQKNSYSKTDSEVAFMRTKDDHMQNGQLKPCYNLQASPNNQFIANYTLSQDVADTTALIGHLNEHIEFYEQPPESVTADAGYVSEENYTDLENKDITAFVKYNYFHKEQHDKKHRENPFHPDKFYYNEESDYCPMEQQMNCIEQTTRKTKTGYVQQVKRYQAKNCSRFLLRAMCHKAQGNRIIERNHNLIRLKQRTRNLLLSEKGIAHRKRRC